MESNSHRLTGVADVVKKWVKDPQAVLDYCLDWALWLSAEDYLVDAQFSCPNASITLLSSNLREDTMAIVWVAGGIVGEKVLITCHITTEQGRQDERTFELTIKEK